ncbi:DUF3105 domain-containing protein [Georgenia sp. SYP-B2076]|uniref:DUF3105 domain-containing protein n=1 Tax=Georgenia sp. SYP-B2076 TaxID=2495881 RepID=UPI001F0BBE8C|nr:DUF3105 domain-containing protein [Georgenia sp. SYP-B2076]
MANKQQTKERAARIAAMRAEQQRKDRRRKLWIFGVVALVCLGLIAAVAVPLIGQAERRAEARAQDAEIAKLAEGPIEGVQDFPGLTANHVTGAVDYPMSPPVGGDHNAVWQNCGIYDGPVANENAVHSLEHGAVWITYSPDLPADQLALLRDKIENQNYGLLTPYEGLESPIVMNAWGSQLALEDAEDPRVDVFLKKYLQGKQTPEPGAACFGGTGTPAA